MSDYYRDNHAGKILRIGGVVMLAIILWITFIQLTCRTPADSENIIRSSKRLSDHDRFCLDLPRPQDFELQSRMVGGNSYTIAISYKFTSQLRFADVTNDFAQKLIGQGWDVTGSHSFTKDRYRLTLSIVSAVSNPPVYDLYCAEVVR